MKKEYEWNVVTQECEAKLVGGYDETWVSIEHDGHVVAILNNAGIEISKSDEDYRTSADEEDDFRIERRVEVEPVKPETVLIVVRTPSELGREVYADTVLSTKTISYKSALELGLIKDGD